MQQLHLTYIGGPTVLIEIRGSEVASLLGNASIIPIHYEGWTHLREGRKEIEQAFQAASQEHRSRFLPPGQPVRLNGSVLTPV